jgi:hypothetical protein
MALTLVRKPGKTLNSLYIIPYFLSMKVGNGSFKKTRHWYGGEPSKLDQDELEGLGDQR